MLTIAYCTCRLDPKIDWFLDALWDQCGGKPDFRLIVVDFHAKHRDIFGHQTGRSWEIIHVPPKPTVWQGPHRLTKEDFFAQSNARNTAICLADDGYLTFVDDLSVPLPGWLNALKESAAANRVVCGAYRKVKELVVEDGRVISFTDDPLGHDVRPGNPNGPVKADPSWMYGCSCGAPLEAFLGINGYPEICDGMGYEDTGCSSMISRCGWNMVYDRRLMTYESQEHHSIGKPMRRDDPVVGKWPNDKSHAVVNLFRNARSTPGYFGDGGIRGLRDRVRRGEPFPVVGIPEHCWFTGTPLKDL